MELRGARVAITGASSGIGAATAISFAEAGAHVHLIARRAHRLQQVAESCRALGVEAHVHVADVGDGEAVARVAASVESHGPCDVAVANAGVMWLGPLLDMPRDEVATQIQTNLLGVIHVLQAFGRPMRDRRRGVLMPVSSILAAAALPDYAAYCASKFGVKAVADSLRMELAGSDIDVVHVLPGATATDLHTHMPPDRVPKRTRQAARVPAEVVGEAIVGGARRPRPHVLCDWRARLLWWGARVLPVGLEAALFMALRSRR